MVARIRGRREALHRERKVLMRIPNPGMSGGRGSGCDESQAYPLMYSRSIIKETR